MFIIHMSAYECVCAYLHVLRPMSVCMHIQYRVHMYFYVCAFGELRVLRCSSTVFTEASSLSQTRSLLTRLVSLASLRRGISCFYFPRLKLEAGCQCPPGIYVGSVDSNSGPHTCGANFNAWIIFPVHANILSGCFLRILSALVILSMKIFVRNISRGGRIILALSFISPWQGECGGTGSLHLG